MKDETSTQSKTTQRRITVKNTRHPVRAWNGCIVVATHATLFHDCKGYSLRTTIGHKIIRLEGIATDADAIAEFNRRYNQSYKAAPVN
jgi:hypothetical protein